MSEDKKPVQKMDSRCPRQLEEQPEAWCPLAVLRLKAIRNAGRELTEEEESKLPGCPWAVNHQLANYCFFNYMSKFGEDTAPSEAEIAHMLNVSVDTIKKTQKVAIEKMRKDEAFDGIIQTHEGEGQIMPDTDSDYYGVRK